MFEFDTLPDMVDHYEKDLFKKRKYSQASTRLGQPSEDATEFTCRKQVKEVRSLNQPNGVLYSAN